MSIRPAPRLLLPLFFINATLVLCHEVDSAYWHEWELFHLPGRAAGFVAMHLLLVPLILAGLVVVARGNPAARWWSFAIGIAGCAGCAVHLAFLADGDDRFTTSLSLALIFAFGISSAALTAVTLAARWARGNRCTTVARRSAILLGLALLLPSAAAADSGLEILTFPVGLVTGEHSIEVDLGFPEEPAELFLDGEFVCSPDVVNPRCSVDLGEAPHVHLLELIRRDAAGNVVVRAKRWINRPGQEAELAIQLGDRTDSLFSAKQAQAYLSEIAVPLLVIRTGKVRNDGWPKGVRVHNMQSLAATLETLKEDLDRQCIVWFRGEPTIGHIADTLPPAIEIAGRRSGLLENTDVKRPQGETLPSNSE